MKRVLILVFAVVAVSIGETVAQNIALEQRVRKKSFQNMEWLSDSAPAVRPYTFIEFFHTSSAGGEEALSNLFYLATEFGESLSVVVLTREEERSIAPMLARYLSPNFGAVVDPSGELFNSFGVVYLPFGILVDKRGRALWMGNSTQINAEILRNIFKYR